MHGKHPCINFEILGPSLLDLIRSFEDEDKTMPLILVKKSII